MGSGEALGPRKFPLGRFGPSESRDHVLKSRQSQFLAETLQKVLPLFVPILPQTLQGQRKRKRTKPGRKKGKKRDENMKLLQDQ